MAKIESIRPGGALDGSFADYPLADLLIGVLRGNLTGRLELALNHEPRNNVYFKDGVPVSVNVPDLGVSVARILAERGKLSKERALEILRHAEETGKTESRLILEEHVLSSGVVMEARRKRARDQLVRLFDASTAGFRFVEGAELPADATLTILQPLPVVFEGLMKSRDRKVVTRFFDEYETAFFRLGPTYPRGVDPFEWGPKIESAVLQLESAKTLPELEAMGISRETATVALATLLLAGMVEVHRAQQDGVPMPVRPRASSESSSPPPVPALARPRVLSESSSPPPVPAPARSRVFSESSSPPPPIVAPASIEQRPQSRGQPLQVGLPFDDSDASGLVVLRRSTGAAERPRGDTRQVDAQELLAPPDLEGSGERPDEAAESDAALDRALRAMAENRLAEAAYLLDWAQALDGGRRDLKLFRGVLRYLKAPRQHRASEAWSLKPALTAEIQRSPNDARLRACLSLVTEANDPPPDQA